MRSIRLKSSALLAMLLLLAACKAPPPPLAAATEFADSGLSLRLPEGWQVREREGSLRVIAQPLRDGQPVPDVYFFYSQDRAAPGADGASPPGLDSFIQRRESLVTQLRGISGYRVSDESTLMLDGVTAERRQRGYSNGGKPVSAVAVLAVRGRCGYELVGMAPAADFARWQPAFTAIVDSLHWRPVTPGCQ